MKIISVISVNYGVPEEIVSFPIVDEKLQHEAFNKANEFFLTSIELISEKRLLLDEKEHYLNEKYFDDLYGHAIYLMKNF